jgi:hypothetical protein
VAQVKAAISKVRGILRPKPGEPSFAGQMAVWKAEDRAIEQCHEELLESIGKPGGRG